MGETKEHSMPQDPHNERHSVPYNEIKIQYREPGRVHIGDSDGASVTARYAVDVPGYPPFIYTVNANYTVNNIIEQPVGMRLEERNGVDTLVYGNGQTLPLSRDMNRAIEATAKTPLSLYFNTRFDRERSNGELLASVSDTIARHPNGGFVVFDLDQAPGELNAIRLNASGVGNRGR